MYSSRVIGSKSSRKRRGGWGTFWVDCLEDYHLLWDVHNIWQVDVDLRGGVGFLFCFFRGFDIRSEARAERVERRNGWIPTWLGYKYSQWGRCLIKIICSKQCMFVDGCVCVKAKLCIQEIFIRSVFSQGWILNILSDSSSKWEKERERQKDPVRLVVYDCTVSRPI